ncbi:alpha/beta fold hydrolase [Proteiniclasticum sp.]|uniref:alpha/beta hydrolase n=1 Tax=Proteiniclasticum sp. TaxID=2053595 RepID=UPI00289FF5CE|nr:alpha/beta fold hydrolase [Proteiniclasticum sp.]
MNVTKLVLTMFALSLLTLTACGKEEKDDVKSAFPEEPFVLQVQEGTLHGSMMYPADKIIEAVVILVPGSGPTDRNGNNPQAQGNNHLKLLAEALAQNGYATLRYDKRGIGESKDLVKKESELTFDLAIEDVVRISEELKSLGYSRLILLGHSEGALIAEAAVIKESLYDALILVSGSALPADELIQNQLKSADQDLADLAEPIVDSLKNGKEVPKVPVSLFSLFRPSVQPYLISWFAYDPVKLMEEIAVPVLVMHGDRDLQVPVEDASVLYEASQEGKLEVIAGMNHILKDSPLDREGNLATYSMENLPLHEDFLDKLIEFLEKL